jgi:murein DD-endopeptidase MepM/ murein hydrolase activator NlpD
LAKAVRNIVIAIVLIAMLSIALPWLDAAWFAIRLVQTPAPATLPIPVENVKRGALADTWHASRPPARRHEGIDIFARKGTPVLATTEGIVLRRGQNRLGGNVLWVLGPGGQRHYYAHLDRFAFVSAGDRVNPGTQLGYVGNTGNAKTTPPHLHYGIYTQDGAINPYPLLAQPAKPKQHE